MNDVKKVVQQAVAEGWTLTHGRHLKLKHPSGAMVVVSISASDRRAALNIRADLRRALRRDRS